MDKKILIPIIVIFVLGIGIFAWHQYFRPEEEVQVPPVEEEQKPEPKAIGPRVILRESMELTSQLPIDVKQGYTAIYDIFYGEEIVGESAWSRVKSGRTKVVQSMNIPGIYSEELMAIITHCPDLLKPKEIKVEGTVSIEESPPVTVEMTTSLNYKTNEIVTIVKKDQIILPAITEKIIPDTISKINIQDLYVGWETDNIKVIGKETVTVPVGTFEILVIQHTGYTIDNREEVKTIYVTLNGEEIKTSFLSPRFDLPIVTKLRSYLEKELLIELPVEELAEGVVFPQFCSRVITIAQLREITGYEGYFSFEVETEDLFITEVCKIRSAARLAEDQPSLKITLAPELENISMTVEELYELKKEFLEWEVWGAEEPEGIGERAFLLIPEEGPILVFIDADINRVVGVAVAAPEFNYEVAINLAKQVEANLE